MITTVTSRQSLFDIALQHCGNMEAAFDIAQANGISLTDDALQQTEGVRMVTLNNVANSVDGINFRNIDAYTIPYAGYFKYDRDNIPTIRNITYKIQ